MVGPQAAHMKSHGAGVIPTAPPQELSAPSQVGISAKAPRPASARLFVDFLLSKEGQRTIQRSGRVPARTDLGDGAGGEALKVHYVHPRLAAQFNQHEKDFRQTFARAP